MEIVPLRGKGKLQDLLLGHQPRMGSGGIGQRLRLTVAQRLRPDRPRASRELAAQLGEERVVGKPGCLSPAEFLIVHPLPSQLWIVRPVIEKVARGFVEQLHLPPLDLFKIHRSAQPSLAGDALRGDPAPVGEKFKADEEGIAGKSRRARIGRVAIAGGAERQNLPDVLLGCGEKGHKLMGGRPQVADAAHGGQGSDVQQNSGGTLKIHNCIIRAAGGCLPVF